jgi:hypothetical protein
MRIVAVILTPVLQGRASCPVASGTKPTPAWAQKNNPQRSKQHAQYDQQRVNLRAARTCVPSTACTNGTLSEQAVIHTTAELRRLRGDGLLAAGLM